MIISTRRNFGEGETNLEERLETLLSCLLLQTLPLLRRQIPGTLSGLYLFENILQLNCSAQG